MNYIRLIQDQAPVIRACLLSVLLTLVTKPRPLYSTCESSYEISQKSQTISRTKSRKIPNNISYEISQNPKQYLVRNLVKSQTIFRTRSHELLRPYEYMIMHEARNLVRDLTNKTMYETKRDETISQKVFYSHYCNWVGIISCIFDYISYKFVTE